MPTRTGRIPSGAIIALIGLPILFIGCGKTPQSQPLAVSEEPQQKELERPSPQIEKPVPDAQKFCCT